MGLERSIQLLAQCTSRLDGHVRTAPRDVLKEARQDTDNGNGLARRVAAQPFDILETHPVVAADGAFSPRSLLQADELHEVADADRVLLAQKAKPLLVLHHMQHTRVLD